MKVKLIKLTSKCFRLYFFFLPCWFGLSNHISLCQTLGQKPVQPYPKTAETRFLKANDAFQNENWDESLRIYQQLAIEFPLITAAQVGVGLSAAKLENHPLALNAFHRVLELMPNATGVQGALANVYRKSQQFDQAEKWYLKAIEGTNSKAPASWYIGLGLLETKRGNYERARQHYIVAIHFHPDNTVAYQNLGTVLFKLNRLDEANASFRAALELAPKMASAFFGRGQVAAKRRNFVAARDFYHQAIELSPETPNFHHSLAQVCFRLNDHKAGQKALSNYRRNKAKVHFSEGRQMLEKSEWKGALVRFQKAEETDPTYTDATRYSAYVQMTLGDYELAQQRYDRVLQIEPNDFLTRFYLGNTEMALGQLKSAEQTFLKVIELAPAYQDCYLELGDVRKVKGDLPGAESAYTMGVLQDPSWAPGYLWRGRLRYQRGDISGAEGDFRSAIQLAPNVAAPQYSLAHLLVEENGNLDMALKWAKSAVFLESAPEHQALLAFVYFRRGQIQLAQAEIERAYQQAPDHPDVAVWRKRIYQNESKTR